MNDLISRQALIEHLRRTIEASSNDGDYNEGFNDGMDFAACFASTLPSAQPERKKGKWIIKDNPGTGWYRVTCSECGEDVTSVIPMMGFFPNAKALWDFCPDCGADMRGEQHEET